MSLMWWRWFRGSSSGVRSMHNNLAGLPAWYVLRAHAAAAGSRRRLIVLLVLTTRMEERR